MVFLEQAQPNGNYTYSVEDVFGAIELTSPFQLQPDMLDALVMHIMKTSAPSGTINEQIQYTFKKADTWIEDTIDVDELPVIH